MNRIFLSATALMLLALAPLFSDTSHVVAKGETLYSISKKYSITVNELCSENNISQSQVLKVGQKLTIPSQVVPDSEDYVVVKGDTFYGVARRHNMTVEELLDLNGLKSSSTLKVGQVLKVPASTTTIANAMINTPPIEISDPRNYTGKKGDSSLLWPVKNPEVVYVSGKISGVQLSAKKNEAVCAIQAGTVMFSGLYRGFGKVVFVQSQSGHMYVYTGLSETSVSKGDYIATGKQLGIVGMDSFTGKDQLTFMVFKDGKPMDPAKAPRG
ncbi:MAG: M23 family metallopeptidase [Spirochaetaceae bacterium]|nr:M23 family metallopeptidase [Spirochaetaceae bacterium]